MKPIAYEIWYNHHSIIWNNIKIKEVNGDVFRSLYKYIWKNEQHYDQLIIPIRELLIRYKESIKE